MSQIKQPPYSCAPWKDRYFWTKKDRTSRLVPLWSPWNLLSNGYLVFNFKIFPYKAIANQSNKVGISQIQQQPPKLKVKIDFFSKSAPKRIWFSLVYCRGQKNLSIPHVVFENRFTRGGVKAKGIQTTKSVFHGCLGDTKYNCVTPNDVHMDPHG